MSFSVVVLSRNPDNLIPCVQAIQAHEPGLPAARIIVVDDGAREKAEPELPGITWVEGRKSFCFSVNANIGIHAAGRDDVLLLNDDALLDTPFGFTGMWGQSRKNPQYGVIASSCNTVGNANQHRQLGSDGKLREEGRTLCFVCVLIPRSTIDRIGGLDEEFTAYGFDDDSFCLRARRVGLKLGIWDGCFVDHSSLTSTFRGTGHCDLTPGLEIFKRKWGHDNFGRAA